MKKTIRLTILLLTLLTITMASAERINVEDRPGMKNMVLVEKGEDSYWINRYEVSYGDYHRFNSQASLRYYEGDQYPIVDMAYLLATRYCNWLSQQEGLAKAYDNRGNLIDKRGNPTDEVKNTEGYRLPTAEEWEYAARGGNKSNGYIYAGSNDLNQVGWYAGNSGGKTQPVGQKAPNELGLYDMSGNAYEWTQTVHNKNANFNIIKGGSAQTSDHLCDVDNAYVGSTGIGGYPTETMGFRIAKTKTKNEQEMGHIIPTPEDDEIIIFTQFFFNGEYRRLKKGTYCDSEAMGLPDNSISSIRIGKDMKVIIYEHNKLNGNRYIYPRDEDGERDIETVEDYFNKQISSLVVIRDGESVDSGDCDDEERETTGQPVEAGEMVLVRAGEFQMGDTRDEGYSNEKPVHTVKLTYDYYIGKYEVTFNEYDAYCEAEGKSKPDDKGWGRGNRPVIYVSWKDAIAYCNWLSEKEGLAKAYDTNGNLLDKNGRQTTDITKVEGYRLPTEAEWEYAARGGHKSTGDYKYAGSNDIDAVAWYSESGTQPVGQKAPNELGLYDMSGNVWEWCHDGWGSYTSTTKTNPTGPNSASYRVGRGGSWGSDAEGCRVAFRNGGGPDSSNGGVGLRIARTRD